MSDREQPVRGDSYNYPDGTAEVVYLVEDGRVLAFREYPSVAAFDESVQEASYSGLDEAVADLPGREAFADLDIEEDEPREGDEANTGDDADTSGDAGGRAPDGDSE